MFETMLLVVSVGLNAATTYTEAGPDTGMASPVAQAAIAMPVPEPEETGLPEPDPAPSAKTAPAVAPVIEAEPEAQLVAEPQLATGKFTTALEVKPILNATRGNWITLREYQGQDLVYVTHLWAWRCGLLEIRIGINGNTPEIWPMPECHMDQPTPGAILDTDGLPYRGYGLGSVALIEVQLTYDDLTTAGAKYNRDGRLVQ